MPGIYTLMENDKSIIGEFHNKIKNSEQINIFGNGSELRTYVHISELSNFIEKIIDHRFSGTLNITTKTDRSILEYVMTLYKYYSKNPWISFSKTEAKPFDIVVKPVFDTDDYFYECMLDFEEILFLYLNKR